MPLIQSLFCLKGKDNRTRFFIIQVSITMLFVVFNTVLAENPLVMVVCALLLSVISGLAALRRANDANQSNKLLLAPSLLFFVTCLLIIFTQSSGFMFALILPFLSQLYLLTFSGQNAELSYHLGYSGPVDLTANAAHYQQASIRRVEPTLAGNLSGTIDNTTIDNTTIDNNQFTEPSQQQDAHFKVPVTHAAQDDIGEQIREFLLTHKQKLAISLGVLMLGVLVVIVTANTEPEQTVVVEEVEAPNLNSDIIEQANIVELSDGFSIASNPYQGIVISWQADDTLRTELWNIATGKGDESCQQLVFNNNQGIRTAQVQVKNNSTYYAVFSPLDSHELVNQLAKRGSFKLCGYDFSLKGSQAALGKVNYYGNLLSY
ncbi:hypothetical protein LP316_12555 [Thalassotalea sp. LPB0316]|uniref:hypothetical protein n=1 Tax=Thalassotalea sp. LPB0316 TaxID=2769490 RepID=UPI0018672339|nr:hypothetical protein [Thalassotalea sp. LPB0316]QOL25125.1 hypothetical protein LP316_12555 [Thalassotalea sp. LPB0316]